MVPYIYLEFKFLVHQVLKLKFLKLEDIKFKIQNPVPVIKSVHGILYRYVYIDNLPNSSSDNIAFTILRA